MTTCSVCSLYGRDGDKEATPPRPPANRCDPGWLVCGYCHGRISGQLKEIPDLYEILDATPGSTVAQDQITGSQEISLGVRVSVLDLMVVPTTAAGVTDTNGDQLGHLPVLAVLGQIADDWRDLRGEHRPKLTVPDLCHWLGLRLDWASMNHPAMYEMADDIKSLTGALYAATGHTKAKPEKMTAPCPNPDCGMKNLTRKAGDSYIGCEGEYGCGRLLTRDEYDRWVGLLVAHRKAA